MSQIHSKSQKRFLVAKFFSLKLAVRRSISRPCIQNGLNTRFFYSSAHFLLFLLMRRIYIFFQRHIFNFYESLFCRKLFWNWLGISIINAFLSFFLPCILLLSPNSFFPWLLVLFHKTQFLLPPGKKDTNILNSFKNFLQFPNTQRFFHSTWLARVWGKIVNQKKQNSFCNSIV